MVENIQLQELLAFFPLSSYEFLNQVNTNEAVFKGITENLEDELANKLIVLNMNSEGIQPLLASIVESDAAIVVLLTEGNHQIETLVKEIQQFPIPIIRMNRTVEDLKDAVIKVMNLKKVGLLYEFIKASNKMTSDIQQMEWNKFATYMKKEWKIDLFITDSYFRSMDPKTESQKENAKLLNKLKSAYMESQSIKDCNLSSFNMEDGQKGYVQKLVLNHEHLGYLCIFEKDLILHDIQIAQLESLIPYFISELKKSKEIAQVDKKYQRNFIYDLLHNNFDSLFAIIDQGRTWNWDLTQPHHLFLINIIKNDDHTYDQRLVAELEMIIINSLSSQFYDAKVVELNGQLVVLFSDLTKKTEKMGKDFVKDLADRLYEKIYIKLGKTEVEFGIGKFYPSVLDLCRSFQEAKMALQFSSLLNHRSKISHFDDLGVVRLLSTIRQEQLDDYMDEYIGKLISYDKQNDSDMVDTLQVFLKENGNLKGTADALYIHTNTLRYRLKKIESTLDVDFQNMEDLLNIILSMKVHGMRRIRH